MTSLKICAFLASQMAQSMVRKIDGQIELGIVALPAGSRSWGTTWVGGRGELFARSCVPLGRQRRDGDDLHACLDTLDMRKTGSCVKAVEVKKPSKILDLARVAWAPDVCGYSILLVVLKSVIGCFCGELGPTSKGLFDSKDFVGKLEDSNLYDFSYLFDCRIISHMIFFLRNILH
jgi:hypothetical protein